MSTDAPKSTSTLSAGARPFRTAVLRGLGVVAPPLLTLVILLWVVRTLDYYIFDPVMLGTRNVLAHELADIRTELPGAQPTVDATVLRTADGQEFKRLESGQCIPLEVYTRVVRHAPGKPPPRTGQDAYRQWVEITYLRPWIVVPAFVVLFLTLMYLLGNIFAAGIGRALWGFLEHAIGRLPLVRSVYGSAKQVTDYMFSDRELEFDRVVAIEYPSRGIWSLAFVTGEGMTDVQTVAGEPMLAILVPTSPFPISGYTMLVPKSEVLDIDMTVEQAVEYIVSCGVLVPPHQLEQRLSAG